MARRVAMYPVNRNPGCSGFKVANTAANMRAAITSLPISPSHPARSRLFALLPARGDITRAARNAFGTTPINPPNNVGVARSDPSQIQTIPASPTAVASCVSRMLRTVLITLSHATKTPRGPPGGPWRFHAQQASRRAAKTGRHYRGAGLSRTMARSRKNLSSYAGLGVSAGVVGAGQPVNETTVLAEASLHDIFEAEVLVEAVGAGVGLEGIDEDGGDRGIGEAALDRLLHHLGAVALADIVGIADPDVDRPVALRDAAPVLGVLVGGVDDLQEADGVAVDLGDELLAPGRVAGELCLPAPVIAAGRGDDVGLSVPGVKEIKVSGRRGPERHRSRRQGPADGVNFGVQAHLGPRGVATAPRRGRSPRGRSGAGTRIFPKARARAARCRRRAGPSRGSARGSRERCCAWSGPRRLAGHCDAQGADDDLRQVRDLREDVHRSERADFDDARRSGRDVRLVEGKAAGADDRRRQEGAQGALEAEEVAAVHDPFLFRFAIVFSDGATLERRGPGNK